MFVDIHTHHFPPKSAHAICNLSLKQANHVLNKNGDGFFSAGFHPWHLNEYSEETLHEFEKIIRDKRIVAIGECGLDKNVDTPLDRQKTILKEQILLSEQMEKPLIIHCVGRFNELLEMRKKISPKQMWIIHGFRGKPQVAGQLLKAGCYLSFGEKFNQESVRITPVDKLFVETDESQLAIETLYKRIAEEKKCLPDKLIAGERWWKCI